MPKSTKIKSYPIEYYDIFWESLQRGNIVIPCASKREGKALQFDLYGFRRAVRLHDESLAEEFNKISMTLELDLETGGYNLTLTTENKFAALLANVLGKEVEGKEIPEVRLPGGGKETLEKKVGGNMDFMLGLTPEVDGVNSEEEERKKKSWEEKLKGGGGKEG